MEEREQLTFGACRIDLHEQVLWRDARPVPVTRRSFDVLAVLLANAGRLVTKAQLFAAVWPHAAVGENALSRCIHELRVALGDDTAAPRYIETAHGRGFRFIAAVAAGGVRAASRAPAMFVGRAGELARLAAALAAIREGGRRLVFVTGEAGIGKTALVDAFIAEAGETCDLLIAQGRCIEQHGAGEAYLPVREALERLARLIGVDEMRATLARYAPSWLEQLSWLAHDADRGAGERAQAGATPQRMLREIAQALEVVSARRPLVLWLEDLHWSDYSTLDMVSFLAGRREPARLLVIATFRPAEAVARGTPLRHLKPELALHGLSEEIALDPLDEAAVASFLAARFVQSPALPIATLARALHRRTEGNPLFLVTVVEDLIGRGELQRREQTWALGDRVEEIGAAIPDSLRELIERGFDGLQAEERRLLEVAAVAGVEFSAASLAAGLESEVARAEEICADLARRGRFLRDRDVVAWPDGTEASGFAFLHALFRQALYERVPAARRIELHRRIGVRQERAYGAAAGAIAAELAMHFEAARDPERCARYLEQAGRNALARRAYLDGIDLLRRALALCDSLPAPLRAGHELELLLPLGAALMAAKGYAASEVETVYRRALELARATGARGALVRALRGLWNVALVRAQLGDAQALAEELRQHATSSGEPALVFDAEAKLGQTAMHRGDFVAARAHLERALELFDAGLPSAPLQEAPRVAAYLSWVLWYLGFPDQGLRRGREALALARASANPHSLAFALGFVAWLHHFRGEVAEARALAEAQHALSTEHALPYWLSWSDFLLGLVATPEASAGLARMRAALAAHRATGAEVGVAFFLCALAEANLAADERAEARDVLAEAAALMARNGNRYHEAELARLEGELLARDGDIAAAALHLDRALAIARAQSARSLELRVTFARSRLEDEAALGSGGGAAIVRRPRGRDSRGRLE